MGSECHRIDQDSSHEEAACTQDASAQWQIRVASWRLSWTSGCMITYAFAPHLQDFCEHNWIAAAGNQDHGNNNNIAAQRALMIAVLYCTIFISMQVVQRIRETFFFLRGHQRNSLRRACFSLALSCQVHAGDLIAIGRSVESAKYRSYIWSTFF